MKGKRMLATLLAAMIACGSVATTASVVSAAETTAMVAAQAVSASNLLPTDVRTPSSGCMLVGIQGDFIADSKAALKRINEIRYEACKEGVTNPSTGTQLTVKDYIPIKWSSDLEYIARIRAVEASAYLAHVRPNGTICFTLSSPNGVGSFGEVLAWNWSTSMVPGIEQWYSEKEIWVNGGSGETGHYTQMIDPENLYVGLGTFCTTNTMYYNTTCGEFSSYPNLKETMGAAKKGITQTIEIPESAMTKVTLSGKKQLEQGKATRLTLNGIANLSTECIVTVLDSITWKSSNPKIVSVDQTGKIKRLASGTATITATTANGKKATLKITERLLAPTVTAQASTIGIKLTWKSIKGSSGYAVYRSGSKTGSYKKIGTTKGTSSTAYRDKTVTTGKRYYYKVKALGGNGLATSAAGTAVSAVAK